MNNNLTKSVGKVEEVLTFYNRYLSLGNDEYLLLNLIDRMADNFIAKIPDEELAKMLYDPSFDITKLIFNSEDKASLCQFENSCLSFHHDAYFQLNDDLSFFIDANGIITYMETNIPEMKCYEKTHVFDFLDAFSYMSFYKKARRDASNIIIQNVLVSKIFWAIHEAIKTKKGINFAIAFSRVYYEILIYQENLAKVLGENSKISEAFPRSRSLR